MAGQRCPEIAAKTSDQWLDVVRCNDQRAQMPKRRFPRMPIVKSRQPRTVGPCSSGISTPFRELRFSRQEHEEFAKLFLMHDRDGSGFRACRATRSTPFGGIRIIEHGVVRRPRTMYSPKIREPKCFNFKRQFQMPSVAGEIDSSELRVMLQWLGFSSCVSRAPQLLKQDLGRDPTAFSEGLPCLTR